MPYRVYSLNRKITPTVMIMTGPMSPCMRQRAQEHRGLISSAIRFS
jgi:hypothetical protein